MENIDVNEAKTLLSKMGIDLSKLSPEKLEKLMSLSGKISDVSQITPEIITDMMNILGLNTNNISNSLLNESKPKSNRPLKIGRNEKCPCESGKKWKNCCM